MSYGLNNNQIACAIAAVYEKKKRRIFLTIPPGKGKSRVIAAIIAYKAIYENMKDFTIMYSSLLLKVVDEPVYNYLGKLNGVDIKQVTYRSELAFDGQVNAGSMLLIDEADYILLNHAI